jgi:hypothetical protein
MAMGVEDEGRLEPARFDALDDAGRLLAGIDHRQHAGGGVAEEHAVGLDRADGKNVEEHQPPTSLPISGRRFPDPRVSGDRQPRTPHTLASSCSGNRRPDIGNDENR